MQSEIFSRDNLLRQYYKYRARPRLNPSYFKAGIEDLQYFSSSSFSKNHLVPEAAQRHAKYFVQRLAEKLSSGKYRHAECTRVLKLVNGKERWLDKIRFPDKLIQGVAATAVASHIEETLLPGIHGFRPGHSCHTALWNTVQLLHRTGARYAVRIDISKFFDNISSGLLYRQVTEAAFPPELAAFIYDVLDIATRFNTSGDGLPTGWPINPPLANLYLRDSDQLIAGLVVAFIRYADDYFIPVRSQEEGNRVLAQVTDILKSLKLDPGPKKSKVEALDIDDPDSLPFLGHVIKLKTTRASGYQVTVLPHLKSLAKIREVIEGEIAAFQALNQPNVGKFHAYFSQYLQGVSAYYRTYNSGRGFDAETRNIQVINGLICSATATPALSINAATLTFKPGKLTRCP